VSAAEEAAVRAVVQAITNEGRVPGYHRQVMQRHRSEWPTLWRALDQLVAATSQGWLPGR
jgi:hypothetical protein